MKTFSLCIINDKLCVIDSKFVCEHLLLHFYRIFIWKYFLAVTEIIHFMFSILMFLFCERTLRITKKINIHVIRTVCVGLLFIFYFLAEYFLLPASSFCLGV